MDIDEALRELKAEYGSGKHWGSDLIISLECAEAVLAELDKDNNIISDLQNEVTLKQCELDNKDKIIDLLLTEITAVNSGRYEYMDNKEVLEIFTKKVEGK